MTWYLWIKALHVIGMVCWFAGLFYLPRLLVYHASATDTVSRERFHVMESKLYRIIMNPAMIVTLLFGIWAFAETWTVYSGTAWIWVKIAGVVALLGYHHYCGRLIRLLQTGANPHSEKFLRIFNEIPAPLLILIVILVVVKPF